MLDSLITSKTRIKLLLKFFLNTDTRAYLRGLAEEFGESTNAVRIELNRLSNAGLLKAESKGRTKVYRANTNNPLFLDIHSLVRKYLGIDVVEETINNLGSVEAAFITGEYAKGIDSGIIDLVLVGQINRSYLNQLVELAEKNIKRKIRILVFENEEFEKFRDKLKLDKALVLWNKQKDKL